ncbi:MAG: hypothetical protein ABEJ78_08335 [Haloferacaceae archaeon]
MLRLLRPRRRLALPFLVALYPSLWLTVRGTGVARGPPADPPRFVASVVGAVALSYLVAALVTALIPLDAASLPPRVHRVVAPPNATLLVVGVVTLALGVYVGGSFVVEFPRWLDGAARVVGVALGWPLVLATLGLHAVGNAAPALRVPFAVELFVTLVGVATSAVWVVVLSGWLAEGVRSLVDAGGER